ncbi:MAG: Na+/H+ antiporter subunit D, partial [Pseudomonadota bacterium]
MTGDWLANFPPGLIMILGAVLVPFLPGLSRKIWMLALPVLAFVHLLGLEQGMLGRMVLFDLELTTLRVDR